MPDNEIIHDAQAMPETAQEKFERERLTRRQALKRFGMTSAMTVFALFSVDDLAHIVGKAMQQRAGDNKVAGQIAKEFQQSGMALAAGPSACCTGTSCWGATSAGGGNSHLTNCQAKCGTVCGANAVACNDCADKCAEIAGADG